MISRGRIRVRFDGAAGVLAPDQPATGALALTSSVVARQANGSWVSSRVTVSRALHSQPHSRHHSSSPAGSSATARQHRSLRLQMLADHDKAQRVEPAERGRIGVAKVMSGTSRPWIGERESSHRRETSPPTRASTRRIASTYIFNGAGPLQLPRTSAPGRRRRVKVSQSMMPRTRNIAPDGYHYLPGAHCILVG